MDTIKIERRFSEDIRQCKLILQYLDSLYDKKNFHILKQANRFFNDLYSMKIDYLISKVFCYFDGTKNVFSIKTIKKNTGIKHDDFTQKKFYKKLKEYRDNYLSHNNKTLERNDFDCYFVLKSYLHDAIEYLFDFLDKIRVLNGNRKELRRKISSTAFPKFYDLIYYGSYMSAHSRDKNMREIRDAIRAWHEDEKTA